MIAFLTSAARRLAGLAVLMSLTAGVPYALVRHIGWPLPHHLPTWQQIGGALASPLTDEMLGNALVCLLWLAWAAFVWSLAAEIVEVLAGIRLPQPKAIAPARGLAALLVAAVTGGVLATAAQASPPLGTPAAAIGHGPAATAALHPDNHRHPSASVQPAPANATTVSLQSQVSPQLTDSRAADQSVAGGRQVTGQVTLVASGQSYTCVVKRGDTLSEIAQEWLGDANRWPEIWALNRGTHFDTVGGTFTSPHLIYPGWRLELPDDATPPARARPATPPAPSKPSPQPQAQPPATAQPEVPAPAAPAQPQPTPAGTTTVTPSPSGSAASPPATDDGVSDPVPPALPPASPSSASATPTGSPTPSASPHQREQPTPAPSTPGVALDGGSWLDAGLVAALLAAVALVWAHRRRRYIPRPPKPHLRLDDPTVEPMPDVVTRIRRALRRPAHTTPTISHPVGQVDTGPDEEEHDPDDQPAQDNDALGPVTPALSNPLIQVWPPAGLGLSGPGAEAAARGFLTAALAAGGLDEPDARSHVVIPSGTLATLLGAAAVTVPDTPRLTVTGGLTDALALLEEHTLHRSRACFEGEADTVSALREADPMAEPLPPMLLITDTTAAHERARIAALLTQGQRLDIHGILLGAWPDGDTVVVAEDGTTSPADGGARRHGAHPADIGRLSVIDPTEAASLLRILAESHNGEPQPPAPAEQPPSARNEPTDTTSPQDDQSRTPNDEKTPPASTPAPAEPDPTPAPASRATTGRLPVTDDVSSGSASPSTTDDGSSITSDHNRQQPAEAADIADAAAGGTPGHVEVQLLGQPRIIDLDPTEPLRGKALELLVYLAARGGTASQEAILEDLLPEASTSRAPHRLHTYVYNLRRVLKRTGGPATYLSHPDRRYILHRDTVSVDLWRMSDALAEANTATTGVERVTALRRAVQAYQGPLADGKGYEWIEPYREAVGRQAVDAALALANALTDAPDEALAVLTTAISHSPYVETLYQAAMRVHATLDDPAAIRDLQRQLARHLDEIDTEVSDETASLAQALITRTQRSRRVSGEGRTSP
ncbi:BTAD domain-containing putative transcriptional regulator [Plantactinospora sp. CA-290183]|uniref:BTAD domain-containing putative transcriptional regulator n=1 Tax=Plantactinospora sp. CA-290183 TaxID=3240006 RepID=UPI003D909420